MRRGRREGEGVHTGQTCSGRLERSCLHVLVFLLRSSVALERRHGGCKCRDRTLTCFWVMGLVKFLRWIWNPFQPLERRMQVDVRLKPMAAIATIAATQPLALRSIYKHKTGSTPKNYKRLSRRCF